GPSCGGPPGCTGGGFALAGKPDGGHVCDSDDHLRAEAQDACKGQGLVLSEFVADDACGSGLSNGVDYACCSEAAPKCFDNAINNPGPLGGPPSCSSDSSMYNQAQQACASYGDYFTATITLDHGACGVLGAIAAKFSCCPSGGPVGGP